MLGGFLKQKKKLIWRSVSVKSAHRFILYPFFLSSGSVLCAAALIKKNDYSNRNSSGGNLALSG